MRYRCFKITPPPLLFQQSLLLKIARRFKIKHSHATISCNHFPMDQFRPPIALRTDRSHITMELWKIPVLQMAH